MTVKTRKTIRKRFKVTGSGKVMRRKPGKRHMLRKRTNKQKRAMSQDQGLGKGQAKMVRKGAPSLFN